MMYLQYSLHEEANVNTYMTPEELAQMLKVNVEEIISLVEQGRLRALRIGSNIRIRETDLSSLETGGLPVVATARLEAPISNGSEVLPDDARWCLMRSGKTRFKMSGSVAEGAKIWPGKMRYPIKFPKEFMESLLARFHNSEVPVGGKFDDPGKGSLGEFIQQKLNIRMNPAVYLAALLIDEGYAQTSRRGYIRFLPRSSDRRSAS